jgi:sugar lactone lactonase YvrE
MERIVSRLTGAFVCVCLLALGGATAASARNSVHGAAARQERLRSLLSSGAVQPPPSQDEHVADNDEAAQQGAYDFERTAPAQTVSGQALVSAQQQAQGLGEQGPGWQLFTTQPYNAEPAGYTDPLESNSGAGFGLVGGRITSLVQAPDGSWFAGAADGGVWRSRNQGQTWTPVFDSMPSLSIGALAIDPADGSLWVGTGEANISSDSYAGTGIYRSSNDGASWQRVGDSSGGANPIVSTTVFKIVFDGAGDALAATDNGLFRLAAHSNTWTPVLQPAGPSDNPPYDQQVTSEAIVPGTNDRQVIAAIGWHGPGNTAYNGFYQSNDGGQTFSKVTPTGDIDAADIGRTTFAYSADGSKLYAIVQSPAKMAAGAISNLQGVFVANGAGGAPASVAGPWTEVADATKLSHSGSANAYGPNSVGAQAWYNQDLAVDPGNPNHVYAGLEEVFESSDGGNTWNTASQYWNFGLACNPNCPQTTHPDQHAMMITDGKIVIGNDGGVYSRPLSDNQQYGDWSDLNSTLINWQYYDARAGFLGGWHSHGVGVWGGLQDNGTSFDFAGANQMIEPAGGDGFDVIVPPTNAATTMVGEYAYGLMYSTTDGGHTFNSYVTPMCIGQEESLMPGAPLAGCDPNSRFLTPIAADPDNPNTWVAGGQYVWITRAGWNTSCTTRGCSWQKLYDTGDGNVTTAIASSDNGRVIYDGWVTNGNPSPTFNRGIATNYGGTWHQLDVSGLPDRYIAGITIDQRNPARAWVVFNGYSRRWIPGGGVGHVFETDNGGRSWTDISGNLPDIASDALVAVHGQLALATDGGAYTAPAGQGSRTRWQRLGTGLPNASLNNITTGPDGYLYAATHGRGVWRIPFPGRGRH